MAGNGSSRVHRKETDFAGPKEPVDHAPVSVLIQAPDLPRPGSLAAVSWPQVLEGHREVAHMVKRMQKEAEEAFINLVKSNQKERDEAYRGVLERMSKLEKDRETVRLQEIETCKKVMDLQHKEAERLRWLEREEQLVAIFDARRKKSVADQIEKHKIEIDTLQEEKKRVMEEFAEAKKAKDALESQLAERTAREQRQDAVIKGAMSAKLESLKRAAEQERNKSEKEHAEAKGALHVELQLLKSKLAATREEHAAEKKAILMILRMAEAERDRLADCERHLLLIAEEKTKEHVEAMEGMGSLLAVEKHERISEAKRAVNSLELQLADHMTKEKHFDAAKNELQSRLAAKEVAERETLALVSMKDLRISDLQSQLVEMQRKRQVVNTEYDALLSCKKAAENWTAQFDDERRLIRRRINKIFGREEPGASGTNAASIQHTQSISDESKDESMEEQHSKKKRKKRKRELCGVKERRPFRSS